MLQPPQLPPFLRLVSPRIPPPAGAKTPIALVTQVVALSIAKCGHQIDLRTGQDRVPRPATGIPLVAAATVITVFTVVTRPDPAEVEPRTIASAAQLAAGAIVQPLPTTTRSRRPPNGLITIGRFQAATLRS